MLDQILTVETFGFFLVFVRLGAGAMVLPGIGENYVYTRVRLGISLALTVVVYPLVRDALPALPATPSALVGAIVFEAMHGLFIGGVARMMMSAMHTAGAVIAFQSGLAYAQTLDPNQGTQSALVSTLMTMIAITLVFVSGLHYELLGALRDSYLLFPAGGVPPVAGFADLATRIIGGAFTVGVQIAAPFFVFGIAFYVGIGLLQRLIPQVQIFFIVMPLQVSIGLVLIAITLAGASTWFLDYFADITGELRAVR